MKLLHAFRAAAPSSRAFDTRLIELVAVAIHRIAAWLQTQDHVLGPDDPLVSWRPSDEHLVRLYPNGYPPALFWHPWYQAYERYPDGVADMVGYWAESRIFGGVVLFDRRKPGSAPDVDVSITGQTNYGSEADGFSLMQSICMPIGAMLHIAFTGY